MLNKCPRGSLNSASATNEIKALKDDSDDIFTTGLLKGYSKRPLRECDIS